MPYIVTGEPTNPKTTYSRVHYDYEYPNDLDLKPDSDFHISLRNKILHRARESRNEISKRFPSWNEIDKTLTAYIPLKDKETTLKKKDPTKPVSIVFPYSYPIVNLFSKITTMAFFQDPMFQYEGVEDSDTTGAMLMELVIKLHCIKTKVPLTVHTIIRDSLSYGVGIGIPGWQTRYGKVPIKSSAITTSELGIKEDNYINFVDELIFEGNDLTNIDPYM